MPAGTRPRREGRGVVVGKRVFLLHVRQREVGSNKGVGPCWTWEISKSWLPFFTVTKTRKLGLGAREGESRNVGRYGPVPRAATSFPRGSGMLLTEEKLALEHFAKPGDRRGRKIEDPGKWNTEELLQQLRD